VEFFYIYIVNYLISYQNTYLANILMNKKIFTISLVAIFSVILWVFVSLSREYFSTIDVNIQITDIPQGFTIGYLSDRKVELTLKGQGWMLAQPTFGERSAFEISVNKRDGVLTLNMRDFFDRNTWVKSNVQVVSILPETIELEVEPILEKNVVVRPNLRLSFSKDFGITSDILLEPDTVTIAGPKKQVERIDTISTVFTLIEGLEDDFVGYLQLEEMNNIFFSQSMIKTEFDVQKIIVKEFSNIEVVIQNVPPGQEVVLIPKRISAVLRGGIDLLSNLKESDINVWITFSQAVDDTVGALLPNFLTPKGTEMLSISPEILNYKIVQF